MAYEKVQSDNKVNTRYVKIKSHKEGDVLVEGTYVDKYTGEYGWNYKFTDGDDAEKFVVIGSKNLNEDMSKLEFGSKVRITLVKFKKVKSGQWAGKTTFEFNVEVDNAASPV